MTAKLTNCGHNCNGTQVLVISQDGPLADNSSLRSRAIMRDAERDPPCRFGQSGVDVAASSGGIT